MAKLIEITGRALSGEWGTEAENGDGIPVIRTTNFTNSGVINYDNVVIRAVTKKNIQEKFLRKGDIIIEKSGGSDNFPVGRVVYFDGEAGKYLFNNFTGLLRVKNYEKWHPKFVFYALYSNYKRGGTRKFENKTTGLHNLKIDDYISRFEIADISKEKQIFICMVLDKLYQLITKRRKILLMLDDLVKARFVEMFGMPILNTKQWAETVVGEIASEVRYGTSKPAVENGKYPYLRMNNLTLDGHLDLSDLKYIDIPEDELEKCVVRKGDILFNRTNSAELVGKTALFDLDQDMIIAGYIIRVRLNDKILPEFFVQYMNTDVLKSLLKGMAKGAVNQANINAKELQGIKVYLPPLELQNEFIKFKIQADKSKAVIEKSLKELETLQASLMQEYFS